MKDKIDSESSFEKENALSIKRYIFALILNFRNPHDWLGKTLRSNFFFKDLCSSLHTCS